MSCVTLQSREGNSGAGLLYGWGKRSELNTNPRLTYGWGKRSERADATMNNSDNSNGKQYPFSLSKCFFDFIEGEEIDAAHQKNFGPLNLNF